MELQFDRRVVDQDVESSRSGLDGRCGILDRRRISDVDDLESGIEVSGPEAGDGLRATTGVASTDEDLESARSEPVGDREPDAGVGAGDKRDVTGEVVQPTGPFGCLISEPASTRICWPVT